MKSLLFSLVFLQAAWAEAPHSPHPTIAVPAAAPSAVLAAVLGQATLDHAVLIRSRVSNGNIGYCSGVVIDASTVLTAAHCVENNTDHHIHLAAAWIAADRPMKSSDYHPAHSKSDSDIGILKFSKALPFSPIRICRKTHSKDTLYRVGFGGRDGKNTEHVFKIQGTGLESLKGELQLATDQKSVSGDSGGPIFALEPLHAGEKPTACLYAIHSSIGLEKLPRMSYNPIVRRTLLPISF